MRINNITLENFRIHENKYIEFEPGLNLLLGDNGTGKSSILEAIGITLFGSSFRDGNIKGQKQCIKSGKKSSLIKIEFLGNDEEVYIVENQLKISGSGFYKLYNINHPEEVLSGNDDVKEKLKVLVGIPGDLREVYDNIVVAKQNEFINNYKQKDSERQKLFDRIFETDIYRAIYDGYSKEVFNKYKSEFEFENLNLNNRKNSLENLEELSLSISALEEKINDTNLNISQKKNEIQKLSMQIEEQNKKENDIFNLNNSILSQEKSISNLEKNIKDNDLKIAAANQSLEIVKKYTPDYEKYIEISKSLNSEENLFSQLDKKNSEFLSLEKDIRELKNSIVLYESQLQNAQKNSLSKNEALKKLSLEKEELFKEIELDNSNKTELEKIVLRLTPLLKEYEILKSSYDLKISSSNILVNKLDNLKESSNTHLNFINKNNLEKLEKDLEEIKNIKLEIDNMKNLLSEKNALLKNNQEALNALSNSVCPYLKDSCKNLEGKNIDDYFATKEAELNSEICELKNKIEEYSTSANNFDPLNLKISKIKDSIKELQNFNNLIIQESLKIENSNKEIENLKLKIENFILLNGEKDSIISKISSINTEILSLDISKKSQKLALLTKELESLKFEISESDMLIEKSENLRDELNLKINNLSINLEALSEFPSKYEKCKDTLAKIRKELELYKLGYSEVLSNRTTASNLAEFQVLKLQLESNLKNELLDLKNMNFNLFLLQEERKNLVSLSQLKTDSYEINAVLETLNKEIGELNQNLKSLNDRVSKNSKEQLQILEIEKKILRLNKKMELTRIFRDNIKDMGIEVSETILREISFLATENFRKITGRAEQIIWSNLESPYLVSVKSGEQSIPFEQLSGGEQVAVAIAIRGAMARKFTNTKFSIFDEPTNNLDLERRKSLSDNIGEILQELDQSIIVTHDDTFREMAQKVIELKK